MSMSDESSGVVFVLGVAHCGSTLLGRMLNTHPRMLCVGEMARIDRCLEQNLPCRCGEPLPLCRVWSRFLPAIQADGTNFRRFSFRLYSRIRELSGKDIIVDISKTRIYRMTRWWRDNGEKYILLIRDPRGVLASAVRSGQDLEKSLRKNKKWTSRLHRFAEKKGKRSLRVYYEDLAARPEAELRRICGFLGIDFAPEMLRPADKAHHFISGSTSDYLRDSNEIRVDERWRTALAAEQIRRIEQMMRGVDLFSSRYLAPSL
jgi:hypothetical protein